MRKFAIVFLATAGICGPVAANAMDAQNTPPVVAVSGASDIQSASPGDTSYQIAHINGEIMNLAQQVQTIRQQTATATQAPTPMYPDSVGG